MAGHAEPAAGPVSLGTVRGVARRAQLVVELLNGGNNRIVLLVSESGCGERCWSSGAGQHTVHKCRFQGRGAGANHQCETTQLRKHR